LETYCRAVAQYRNIHALHILEALTDKATYPDSWYLPQNKKYVFKAIFKYNCGLYKKLYSQLKPQMDKDIFDDIAFSSMERPPTWR